VKLVLKWWKSGSDGVSGPEVRGYRFSTEQLIISGFLGTVATLLLLALLVWYLAASFGYMDRLDPDYLNSHFVYGTSGFKPESVERLQYVSALIIGPLLILSLNALLLKVMRWKKFSSVGASNCFLALATILTGLLLYDDYKTGKFYLSDNIMFKGGVLVTVIVIVAICLLIPTLIYVLKKRLRIPAAISRWGGPLYALASAAIVLPISFMYFFNGNGIQGLEINHDHLNAVLYPVVQVHAGKALLVDTTSQYGLYAQMLQPLFAVIGLDLMRFTLVMSLLVLISFLSIAIFLYFNVNNKLIAFLGFATVAYYGYLFDKVEALDAYFQYIPIRLIFPALLLLLAWTYFRSRSRRSYYLMFGVASIGALWNMDTGAIVFLTWLLTLAYDEWLRSPKPVDAVKRSLKHAIVGLCFLSLSILAYVAYVYAVRGTVPNFGMMTEYQQIFYSLGYYMLPMPGIHPWNLVAIVYLAGVTYAVLAVLTKSNSYRARLVFMLTILGCGIFSYYQGRSHDLNLPQVLYPAILLLTLFADSLYNQVAKWLTGDRTYFTRGVAGMLALSAILLLFVSSAASLVADSGFVAETVTAGVHPILSGQDTKFTEESQFIRNNTHPGDGVIVLSEDQSALHAETGTYCPVKIPSLIEILLIDDYMILQEALENKSDGTQRVFLDSSYKPPSMRLYMDLLDHYTATNRSHNSSMILYTWAGDRPWKPDVRLDESSNTVFHAFYDAGGAAYRSRDGYPAKFTTGGTSNYRGGSLNYTVELIVQPEPGLAPGSCLFSDDEQLTGSDTNWALISSGDVSGTYKLEYTDSDGVMRSLPFAMNAGQRHYVAIVRKSDSVNVFVDGVPVANTDPGRPAPEENQSQISVRHLIPGVVEEVQVSLNADDRDIAAHWAAVRHLL